MTEAPDPSQIGTKYSMPSGRALKVSDTGRSVLGAVLGSLNTYIPSNDSPCKNEGERNKTKVRISNAERKSNNATMKKRGSHTVCAQRTVRVLRLKYTNVFGELRHLFCSATLKDWEISVV